MHAYQQELFGPRVGPSAPTMFVMVGLPGAGKTTMAKELARSHPALRMTPDDWHLPLFGESLTADGKRDTLEGRLITVALRALRLGTSVILDFGLWSRDERSALRWLAEDAAARCYVVYLPVDLEAQLVRVAQRQTATPDLTFPMPATDIAAWRNRFQEPDAAELAAEDLPGPPPGWATWLEWAEDRWPTLDPYTV